MPRSRFLRPDRAAKRRESPRCPRWNPRPAPGLPSRRRPPCGGGCGAALSCWVSSASSARWTSSTSPTGCTPLSVQGFGLRPSTTWDQSIIRSGSDPRTRALHVPKAVMPPGPVTSSSPTRCIRPGTSSGHWASLHNESSLRLQAFISGSGRRESVDVGSPYLFTAASFEPRKNLGSLLDLRWCARRRPEVQLLIAGLPSGSGGVEADGVPCSDTWPTKSWRACVAAPPRSCSLAL